MAAPTARKDLQSEEPTNLSDSISADNDEEFLDMSGNNNEDTNKIRQMDGSQEKDGDLVMDQDGRPKFSSVAQSRTKVKKETRNVSVPPHRYSPLRAHWSKIYAPLVQHLKLQVKMDTKNKKVMIRTCKDTSDPGAIQKGEDFLKAFMLGFDIDDAVALLRLDDLYIETFEIKDVKTLNGDHLARAIGRIAGKDGKTKFAIENASRTRVVLADSKIHILGGFSNIKIARETIVSLILGAPPGKVYGNLRIISSRMKERF